MDAPRRRHRALTTAAVAVLLPFAAACGGEQAGPGGSDSVRAAPPLTGVRWSVDSVTEGGRTLRAPADAHLTVEEGGRAEGSYGCNRFRGDAGFEGDRIRLRTESTAQACPEPLREFERRLGAVLERGPLGIRVRGDQLTLTTEDGTSVRLSRAGHAPLHGTKWSLALPGADGRAHLTFDREEGTVSGSAGCNHVSADATVRDGHITLGAPSTTRMMCEGSLMDVEERVLRLFDGRAAYRIEYRNLTLTSDDGVEVPAFATG
ncbi:META domain-containing protein [Streptomyces sp. NPDC029526]|uniref:META domain-containing protein n=1 Tax=Streptomyces sp. NPDC029526 TaxID=3155728 RepID=UPI0033C80A9E